MARFLRNKDYERVSIDGELNTLIEGRQQVLIDTELAAQAEMIGHLTQRYDVEKVFTNTVVFSELATYNAKQLVEYTEPTWDSNYEYSPDERVVYKDKIYKCLTYHAGKIPNVNSSDWEYICEDKSLFYGITPEADWNFETKYQVGDNVFYNNSVYTSQLANSNILPNSSTQIWGVGTPFTIPSATLPDDDEYWVAGDNRNQQAVLYMLVITLYWLYFKLNPRFIPDKIKEAYDGNSAQQTGGAKGFLKQAADGRVNFDIPERVPIIGLAIQGGNSLDNNPNRAKRDNMLW